MQDPLHWVDRRLLEAENPTHWYLLAERLNRILFDEEYTTEENEQLMLEYYQDKGWV